MLLQAPPSVVAVMIGYGPARAEAIAAQAGGTWKHYAAGDHTRPDISAGRRLNDQPFAHCEDVGVDLGRPAMGGGDAAH
jgi:hypothetical protein